MQKIRTLALVVVTSACTPGGSETPPSTNPEPAQGTPVADDEPSPPSTPSTATETGEENPRPGRKGGDPERLFTGWDVDGDRVLVADELPERMRGRFKEMDADANGAVTLEELKSAMGPQPSG